MLFDASIINPQELGAASVHVAVVMFALGAFAIKELKDGIIGRCVLDQTVHHLK